MLDTGPDVTIISLKFGIQIGLLGGKYPAFRDWNFISCKIKYRMGQVYRIRGQTGKLKSYVANIAMKLWGHDLLQN